MDERKSGSDRGERRKAACHIYSDPSTALPDDPVSETMNDDFVSRISMYADKIGHSKPRPPQR